MYPISTEALELFNKGYRQTVEIIFYGVDDTFTITERDIRLGGLTVDRCSVSGSKIELGSASAAELSLNLNNSSGKFNDVKFEGAELFVRIAVTKHDALNAGDSTTHFVPVGYFIIDEPYRKLTTIPISALDRMVLFDKKVDWSLFTFPITVKNLLSQTCDICNVQLGTDISDRPNSDYLIKKAPTDETTYRQVIQWVAELTATCGFMDWEGKLCLTWYTPSTAKISPSERYSSDMLENDIVISGIEVVDEDSSVYLTGDDSYVFRIEGNSLIQDSHQEISNAIYQEIGGFSYRPYECVGKPMPYLFPMDIIEFVDKDGVSHDTIVTNVTFTLNGQTGVMGQGETETNNGYAKTNPLTKRESLIIKTIQKALNETLNSSVQSVLAFNELITNSLGVYSTVLTMEDGSKKYYMHDAPTLEGSTYISTRNAGGFAFTNTGWNNGNPIWESGFTKDGNVIAKKVNAYGIEVSDPSTKYSSQITPGVFAVWYGAMQILTVNGDESIFTKVKIKDQAECGKTRMLPHYEDDVLIGTNIVFIDD